MPTSAPATPPLSAARRRELRAAAHHLDPVVMIGDAGLSPGVLAETDRALTAHELIKLRVFGDDRQQRRDILASLCAELGCQPVQEIGKLLVLYRERPPEAPREHVPKKFAATGATSPRRLAGKTGKAGGRKAGATPLQRRAGSGPLTDGSRRRGASAPARGRKGAGRSSR